MENEKHRMTLAARQFADPPSQDQQLIQDQSRLNYDREYAAYRAAELTNFDIVKEMSNAYLSVLKYVTPFVIGAQMAVGDTVPGATKKAKVLASLHAAAGVAEAMPDPMVELFGNMIDIAAEIWLDKPRKSDATVSPDQAKVASQQLATDDLK